MPWFMVRCIERIPPEEYGCEIIRAADEEHAAKLWRRKRDLPWDLPLAVTREEVDYPVDEWDDDDDDE